MSKVMEHIMVDLQSITKIFDRVLPKEKKIEEPEMVFGTQFTGYSQLMTPSIIATSTFTAPATSGSYQFVTSSGTQYQSTGNGTVNISYSDLIKNATS